MNFYKSFFLIVNPALLFFGFLLFTSCESSKDKGGSVSSQSSVQLNTDSNTSALKVPHFSSNSIEVKTYEVKDSTGKSLGWGYDIYMEGKKTIHQPIIPAIPGNRSFKTENDARKVGAFAVGKMKNEGSLPTILVEELDSLGVIK